MIKNTTYIAIYMTYVCIIIPREKGGITYGEFLTRKAGEELTSLKSTKVLLNTLYFGEF